MNIDPETGEVITPFLRTPYNYNMDKASEESGLLCEDETRTQQNFCDECDINTILEKFGVTGELPATTRMPIQADFTDVMDYQTAMNAVIAADAAFMELPAKTRARFQNDPQQLMEFLQDEGNRAEAKKLGLLAPEVPKTPPMEVRVVPDAPAS